MQLSNRNPILFSPDESGGASSDNDNSPIDVSQDAPPALAQVQDSADNGTSEPQNEQPVSEDPNNPAWLKPRLDQAKRAAEKQLLKQLGIASPEDAKAKLSRLSEYEQAEMTAAELLQSQVDSLQPKAQRFDQMETTILTMLSDEMESIPDDQKGHVDGILEEVPTPEGKLRTLRNWRKSLTVASPPVKPKAPNTNASDGGRPMSGNSIQGKDADTVNALVAQGWTLERAVKYAPKA